MGDSVMHFFSSLSGLSALLLANNPGQEEANIARLLAFFDIPWEMMEPDAGYSDPARGEYVILISAACMHSLCPDGQYHEMAPVVRNSAAVYVYGFQDDDQSAKLLRFLTGNQQAAIRPINVTETRVTITAKFPEMCGPMSGMQVPALLRVPGFVCTDGIESETCQTILQAKEGAVFLAATCNGVRFCLNLWGATVDLSALAASYFDVRRLFFESVPLVFYLRWLFRVSHTGTEINACLIVDDPSLKRRYGHLDFQEALGLMDRHNFTTAIAFIPWNWRRTNSDTLSLFHRRPDRFSLVIHGCDHTGSEFGERSPELLDWKIRKALRRMEAFERTTLIRADDVMVFPQGVFSPEAGRALKLNGFIAAVNTEVAPAPGWANLTRVADLWSMAIMRYGSFPIFTRRYLHHGIENFAFDGLLGKPCLIASHHDIFKDHGRNLSDFISRLNGLPWNIVWRPLAEVVRRTARIRRRANGASVLQIFAGASVFTSPEPIPDGTILQKEETDPESVVAVHVNDTPVDFRVEDGLLRFRHASISGQLAVIRIVYRRDGSKSIANADNPRTRARVAAKRYLSEFRDNYLARSEFAYHGANWLMRHIIS